MNRLPIMIFGCLHSRDNKCSFCSIKIIFISKIPSEIHRLERSRRGRRKFQIVSVKFVERCQSFFIINPQVIFTINNRSYFNRTVAFLIGEREKMSAPSCCACKTLLAPSYPLTRCDHSGSFFRIKA